MWSRGKFVPGGQWPRRALQEAAKGEAEDRDVWLFTKEAAEYLRMSPRTLERWRSDGGNCGPVYGKLGPSKKSRVVYRLRDLEAWRARFRYNSTSEYGNGSPGAES